MLNWIFFSAGVPDGLSSKDGLYNDLVLWMEERNLLFLNADNEGKYFAQVSMSVCSIKLIHEIKQI